MWTPQLELDGDGPLYRIIADALGRDVAEGRVRAGERLPTHRDLAERLGVNVGTVTRAYAEASRRGLVEGEVGRGTYVRAQRRFEPIALAPGADGGIDLAFNVPSGGATAEEKAQVLDELREADLEALFDRYQGLGLADHRRAGADWIGRAGLEADPARVVVTGGAQQAMTVCLSVVAQAGDLVLTDECTYPGIKTLAAVLGLRLGGLAMDDEGLLPDAFEHACQSSRPKALYCMPNVHNPTGIVMSPERRRAVADVARKHGVVVLEDDTYGFLCGDPPAPIAALLPELSYFITSTSKSLAAGLRVGYVQVPADHPRATERLASAVAAVGWMTPPLCAAIAARWIEGGVADRVVQGKRREAAARRQIVEERLGPLDSPSSPSSCHVWWRLPEPWRADGFVARARAAGVSVTPPEVFVVGRRSTPHAVRVCIGTPETRVELERALDRMADVLRGSAEVGASIV